VGLADAATANAPEIRHIHFIVLSFPDQADLPIVVVGGKRSRDKLI
jgi:hypothetical protein